jgi:hypothetical protein
MLFASALDQLELGTELAVELLRGIPLYVQATALLGAVGRERGNHHIATRPDCRAHLFHIPLPVALPGKEMKHGAVVPDVI